MPVLIAVRPIARTGHMGAANAAMIVGGIIWDSEDLMGTTKRQHFVPRFYLSNFASSQGQLYVYDKVARKRLKTPVSIENVAVSGRFYDLPTKVHDELLTRMEAGEGSWDDEELIRKVNDPQMIEHHLSDHEAQYAVAIAKLLEAIEMKSRIQMAHRQIISHFLVVQRMRTPAFRQTLLAGWQAVNSRKLVLVDGEARTFSLPPLDENLEQVVHANAFTSASVIEPAVETLTHDVWRIGLNNTSQRLYTSDDPAIFVGTLGHKAANLPLGGLRVIFPITPKVLLIIFEQGTMTESTPMSLSEFALTDELVAYANRLQVLNCSRQVYGLDDQFDLAEAVVGESR